jgi:hypothetical protein
MLMTAQLKPVPKSIKGWNNVCHFVKRLFEGVAGADSGSLRA